MVQKITQQMMLQYKHLKKRNQTKVKINQYHKRMNELYIYSSHPNDKIHQNSVRIKFQGQGSMWEHLGDYTI